MIYVVKSRELKWAGKTLLKGSEVEPKSDRDHKHIELLAKIGKVEPKPEGKPLKHAATMKPRASDPEPEPVLAPAPEAVAEDFTVPEPPAEDESKTYRTRRLKAED